MAESYSFGHWGTTSEEILKSQFPLHRACRDGDVELLSLLLVEAQHGIYVEDSFYGWTPAHWAAYFGKLNCLTTLLESGMACDASTIRLNQIPVQIAAFAGQLHCLKWLIHCGAAINRQDYLGETAIHKAARTGSMECISLLFAQGAKLFIRNNNGNTPAQLARLCGYPDCATFLEDAAVQQEPQPKGVFQDLLPHVVPSQILQNEPSPHDITAKKTEMVNAGHLPTTPPNGFTEECEMEDDAKSQPVQQNGFHCQTVNGFETANGVTTKEKLNGQCNGDVTVNPGITFNHVPVAGKKRTREDAEECEFKRMRRAEPLQLGFLPNRDNLAMHIDAPWGNGQQRVPFSGCHQGQFNNNNNNHHPTFGSTCASNSAVEHQKSVVIEQGYDSMFVDAMVSTYHGS